MNETEQRTPEWHAKRCGKITASRIADMMARPKVPGKGMRANYLAQLVTERLTGVPAKTYQNGVMQEGSEWEPKARAAYIFRTDNAVTAIDFFDHPDIPMAGCSPDGFVGHDGLVEIKCPFASTHLRTLTKEEIDGDYIRQMQWQMACTGRQWCDFVSYNDDMPPHLRLWVKRVPRDVAMIGEITAAVRSFQTEIDLTLSVLKEKYGAG